MSSINVLTVLYENMKTICALFEHDKKRMATTEMRMCGDGQGGEPVKPPEKLGDLGGSEGGTDSDGYEKEKAGMVRARLQGK